MITCQKGNNKKEVHFSQMVQDRTTSSINDDNNSHRCPQFPVVQTVLFQFASKLCLKIFNSHLTHLSQTDREPVQTETAKIVRLVQNHIPLSSSSFIAVFSSRQVPISSRASENSVNYKNLLIDYLPW
jgi:hypothetical protein